RFRTFNRPFNRFAVHNAVLRNVHNFNRIPRTVTPLSQFHGSRFAMSRLTPGEVRSFARSGNNMVARSFERGRFEATNRVAATHAGTALTNANARPLGSGSRNFSAETRPGRSGEPMPSNLANAARFESRSFSTPREPSAPAWSRNPGRENLVAPRAQNFSSQLSQPSVSSYHMPSTTMRRFSPSYSGMHSFGGSHTFSSPGRSFSGGSSHGSGFGGGGMHSGGFGGGGMHSGGMGGGMHGGSSGG